MDLSDGAAVPSATVRCLCCVPRPHFRGGRTARSTTVLSVFREGGGGEPSLLQRELGVTGE
ncbi:hypothetical protein [Streptomyces sulphureus]|uniref:hypothetical protein n=1 Tax=Streptomyces sulphureus TaxID=47758 RepID=UPI000362A69B|nr:hypothetical protein [Streptomyces sulphureus]